MKEKENAVEPVQTVESSTESGNKLDIWLQGAPTVFFLVLGIGKVCHAREIEGDWVRIPHYFIAYIWLMFAIYFLRKAITNERRS